MSRRRNIKFLSVLASASLIVAASCSGDDDDGAISEGTSAEGTSAGTESEGTDLAPEDTQAESTEPEGTEPAGEAPAGAEDVGVEGGSACGIPHGPWEDTGEPAGEVRVAWNDPMLSYNARTSRGNAVANNNPLYLMGLGNYSGFSYYDQDLNYINNDQFGTCTLDSLDPLTVTYRINEGVTWSDGTPMDAADMLLEWAGGSEVFNDADPVIAPDGTTAEADADGNPIIVDASGAEVPAEQAIDPETEELLEGYTYKESTGVLFDSVNESYRLITQVPVVSEDGQAVTATWDQFFVDYQTNPFAVNVPAHVVAKYALGVEDPTEGKQAIIDAIRDQRSRRAEGDRRLLQHRIRLHVTPGGGRPLPQRRAVPDDLVRRAEPADVRGQPGLHVGSEAQGADDRLPHHRRAHRRRAGPRERGDRHDPPAVDGRHPHPGRGARRPRRRGRDGQRRDLRARRPRRQQRRAVRSRDVRR